MDKISPKLLPRSLLPRKGVIEQDNDEKQKKTLFRGRYSLGAMWQVPSKLRFAYRRGGRSVFCYCPCPIVYGHDLTLVVLIGQIHSLS